MRTSLSLLIGAAALAGVALVGAPAPAQAQEYPWCAQYGGRDGGRNCGFVTYGQCMAALWGNGGFCERNPFYHGPYGGPPPYQRRPYGY
jgi:hypothetical protein